MKKDLTEFVARLKLLLIAMVLIVGSCMEVYIGVNVTMNNGSIQRASSNLVSLAVDLVSFPLFAIVASVCWRDPSSDDDVRSTPSPSH